ncbi:MAG TPA: amidohydrolase family protein [Thermoanaerobaculia bacterium]|jgi:hypothetical protein|nr:amidohydrolase family protein [Thermoanaerobaculia bacterium]
MRHEVIVFGLILLLTTVGIAGAEPPKPLRIIDVHTHPEFEGTGDESAAAFDAQRKKAGVVFAVGILHSDDGQLPESRASNTIYCAGVRDAPNTSALEQGLKRRDYRCIKIYLGYTHKYAYDPVYEPVFALAEKYDVPVIFHTGDTNSKSAKLKFADPLTIDEVAVDHPRVTFVIAHGGNPWIQSAAEVVYKNPNVYLDGSAFLVGDVSKLPPDQVEDYMVEPLKWIFGYVENPEKLMFGSDWPLVDIPAYVEAFKRAIPREHWQKVFHDNAVKVFRLKQLEGTQ